MCYKSSKVINKEYILFYGKIFLFFLILVLMYVLYILRIIIGNCKMFVMVKEFLIFGWIEMIGFVFV